MTPDQKAADFSQLAATYALNYGPLQWKTQIFNFDLRDISSWLAKAAQTQDDLDFYELCASYVASLNDAHDRFVLPSDFFASLSFSADIYDGKVIIDAVGQSLSRSAFGVRVGDELVSIDSIAVSDLMQSLSRYSVAANPRSTQRLAADYLTYRDQSIMPHAHQVPDTSSVVVNRDGNPQTVSIAWVKTGTPITTVGPVIPIHTSAGARFTSKPATAGPTDPLRPLRNMRLPGRNFIAGFGQTAPVFQLPSNFLLRMGAGRFDFFYSGTFQAGGFNIGYLRVPTFEFLPDDILQAEIDYMQQSTDGLIVDVMRNPGGDGCAAEDLASRLIPAPFTGIGLDVRATWFWVEAYIQALQDAAFFGEPPDVVAQYQALLNQVTSAYMTPSGIAGPLPICQSTLNLEPATDPKRGVIAYTKPVMVLVDEFSASAAELFAADMQDNQRAVLFGMRTMGAGGNVDQFPVTTYSYGTATITESLMHRLNPVVTPDYPTAPYVENIGVRPDVVMDYMTVDNLVNHGATFVQAFSDAMVRYLSTGAVQ
ncbi:MAG TPA: S41 family peptidase [Bryobacteraceae bacterium]